MIIVTADLPSTPNYAIERDVSIFQAASKKSSKPAKESKDDQAVREYLQHQCDQIVDWCVNEYGRNSGSGSSALKLGIQRGVTNYLMSVNHPIALKMLQEYKAEWKKW